MTIDAYTLERLPLVKTMAAECRTLAAEVKLASEHLPRLNAEGQELREALGKALPSKLIAFDKATSDQFARCRHCDVLAAALSSSLAHHKTRLAVRSGDLKREIDGAIQRLIEANPDAESRTAIRAVKVAGETDFENAARLLQLCGTNQEGAQI